MLDFGLIACRRAVPDVDDIADYLVEEHRALLAKVKALDAPVTPAEAAPAAKAAPASPRKPPARKAAPRKTAAREPSVRKTATA